MIQENQEEFVAMLNSEDEPGAGGSGNIGANTSDPPGYIQVSQEDKQAIDRVNFENLRLKSMTYFFSVKGSRIPRRSCCASIFCMRKK